MSKKLKITDTDIREAVHRAFGMNSPLSANETVKFTNEVTEIVARNLTMGTENLVIATACAKTSLEALEYFAADVCTSKLPCDSLLRLALKQVDWSRISRALVEREKNTLFGDIDVADAYKTAMKNTRLDVDRN